LINDLFIGLNGARRLAVIRHVRILQLWRLFRLLSKTGRFHSETPVGPFNAL
jgi:hypothetical protein